MKYGYVACIGRSPADMKENMTVAEGLIKEEEYF